MMEFYEDLGRPMKAGNLFSIVMKYKRAAECYHAARDYNEAAAALHKGQHYDSLVEYLTQ